LISGNRETPATQYHVLNEGKYVPDTRSEKVGQLETLHIDGYSAGGADCIERRGSAGEGDGLGG